MKTCAKLFLIFFVLLLTPSLSEAACTLAWNPTTTNVDGSQCNDLAGYKIYYDTDQSGPPYKGVGLPDGDSPIFIPLSALVDPANPTFTVLTPNDVTYYWVITSIDASNHESTFSNEVTSLVITTDPLDVDDDGDGLTENQGDCDDTNPNVHPGAVERCENGIDDDCDGKIDTADDECKTPAPPVGLFVGCTPPDTLNGGE